MDRRPHPDHDRRLNRRMAAGLVVVALAWGLPLGLYFLAGREDQWVWGVALGCMALAVAVMTTFPINRTRCPTCGRRLTRQKDSAEFVCERCRVVWTTRSYGGTIWG